MDIQTSFAKLVDMMAPPIPDALGGAKLRAKINSILAPRLLNTLLPPLPKGLANNKTVQALSPQPATKGPPLPSSFQIVWPKFH